MSEPAKDDFNLSRHPITILLVGAIISSLLIPSISHVIAERRENDLARRQKAAEILKAASKIDRQVHLIATAFENFEQDVTAYQLKDDEFKWEQKELRKQIY